MPEAPYREQRGRGAAEGGTLHLGELMHVDHAQRRIDVQALQEELGHALRHGGRAPRLFIHGRNLVDLLIPANREEPERTRSVRSIMAESIIRAGIEKMGGQSAEALIIVFALRGDKTAYPTLGKRRREAAQILGVHPSTFRLHREDKLVWDLAFEILEMLLKGEGTPTPSPTPQDHA